MAIFISALSFAQNKVTISGKISDKESGEDIFFASVYIKGTQKSVTSNEYGFYSLTIDTSETGKEVTLVINSFEYGTKQIKLTLDGDKTINHKLESSTRTLKEAVVTGTKTKAKEELESTDMSSTKLSIGQIKHIPTIGGETDIIKVVQLLPGVSSGLEGTSGMFVRGGDADQNLVLLDESTVYNIGHLFGFFSVFNPDAIKDMTMIKGAFPAQYGGRLSSILDIKMNEGNLNKFHAKGGIGLLSSRLTLEAPIIKEKMSFLISGRRTYIDQVFKAVGLNVPYYFYDLNTKLNYKISDKDRIFYSGYFGNDVLRFNENDSNDKGSGKDSTETDSTAAVGFDFGFTLGNFTNTIRWNHIYNNKLFSNISFISTSFDYNIRGQVGNNVVQVNSNIVDFGLKADWDYFVNEKNHIKFGANVVQHIFKPNILSTEGDISDFVGSSAGERLYTTESAIYGYSDRDLNVRWKLKYGLRISSSAVKNKFYAGLEPRIAARYKLAENDALKFSYSRMKQYMHRVSSSTVALPTDLWYPVTENIAPQKSDQVAVGYHHLFPKLKTALTIEGYYKWLGNVIEYREGANLILNDEFENELLQGTGDAWGAEFLLKRESGKFTGWASYTLSWATRDFDDLNNGETFWAKYDRRHNISLVGGYQFNERLNFSAVWVYQTGARFTAQIGQYAMPNAALTGIDLIPIYTERNAVQMSPGHRLDLNFSIKSKPEKKFKSEWSFGCYNTYNYATPYRINIVPTEDGIGYRYEQPGLFGFIPSIAYNFEF